MQVLVEDDEYATIQRAARSRKLTLAEWVRQALRAASRQEPSTATDRKLAAIRAASEHEFPAPDIEQMLDEIERGYRSGPGT